MKKIIWMLPLVLLLAGCGGPKLDQLTTTHDKQDFKYPVGTSFQIVLPSNQTTGYKWEIEDITAGVLETVKNTYRTSKKYGPGIVGAGGEEIWTFKVLTDDRSHIIMKYRKPWAKSEVANEFMVTVNGNPGDDGLLTFFGQIKSAPAGSAYNDYFVAEDGTEFGIAPYERDHIADPGVKSRIAEFADKTTRLEIRGSFIEEAAEHKGQLLVVNEIRERPKR